ncbi:MAG: glycine--tRNA ligase [Methanophagales archaeon]|nr:glycine--tRNA ligase [Methanophagales archaeon]MCW3140993.1 glycine--tRNA ligase [Methanophagales archaeon]
MASAGSKEGSGDGIAELARRRGFLWLAFEIYGGAAGFYDYGPLGALLKRRVEEAWRNFYLKEGFYEIETTNIAPREIFEASGHLESFTDRAVVCKHCKSFFRVSEGVDVREKCPECGGELENAGEFNLMFQTRIGVPKGGRDEGAQKKSEGYLRPETAQGIFLNFQRLLRFNRDKLPFGVIQIGKAYRNEISPRKSLIRLREFTMAEAEVFVDPGEKSNHPRFEEIKDRKLWFVPSEGEEGEKSIEEAVRSGIIANEYLGYHIAKVEEFLGRIGIPQDKLRFRQHRQDEMAHYARDCWDAEFFSERYGWMEIVGVADRGDYDLSSHASHSNTDMGVHGKLQVREGEAEKTKAKIIPHVIEPSYGIDRIIYALLESSLYEEQVGKEKRKVLRFKNEIAPIIAAVFPLLNRDELKSKAKEVFQQLRDASIFVEYDDSGSIGRRYRRQDEIGTPYCITIDYETLEDDTVTIRERDTMEQVRVPIAEIKEALFAQYHMD